MYATLTLLQGRRRSGRSRVSVSKRAACRGSAHVSRVSSGSAGRSKAADSQLTTLLTQLRPRSQEITRDHAEITARSLSWRRDHRRSLSWRRDRARSRRGHRRRVAAPVSSTRRLRPAGSPEASLTQLSAPDHAPGYPKPRPASANPPPGPRWHPGHIGLGIDRAQHVTWEGGGGR